MVEIEVKYKVNTMGAAVFNNKLVDVDPDQGPMLYKLLRP
jgi:hypothetical protein